jgi:hypothetical protein
VIGADYLGQASLRATIVPARAAYLVREGSESGFRRAVQEASTRWGGMTEPVVPIADGSDLTAWWQQVVELAGVDGAVNVDVPQDDADAAAARLGLVLIPLVHIDRTGPVMWTSHPASLGPQDGPDQAWVIACDGGSLWQAVAAGDLTEEHMAGLAGSELSVRRPRSGDEVERAQIWGGTLLDRTVAHFAEYSGANGPWPCPTILWIVDANNLQDCIYYWNLRALRPLQFASVPMLLAPLDDIEHWVGFDRQLAGLLTRPDEFSPDVVLQSLSAEESALRQVANALGLRHTNKKVRISQRFPPPPLRQAPFTYAINVDVRPWFVFRREYGEPTDVDVHLFRGGSRVRFSSPVPFSNASAGYALVRLAGAPFEGLPQRPSVAGLVVPNADWRAGSIQIRTNAAREYLLQIRVPSLEDAARTLLAEVTGERSPSDKGRLGMALQAKTDISALLEPGMYEAVAELTTPRSRQLERELRSLREQGADDAELVELAARWGGRSERRYRSAQELSQVGKTRALEVLEKLCAIEWAERGLEINCSNCGVRSFVPLPGASAKSQPRCPGCGTLQGFTADAKSSGLSMFYRLDTFVDRASDQGILPHLLVIAALARRSPHSWVLPGVTLSFVDGLKAEADIFGVHDSRVIAGEVKTSAAEFSPEQMARDAELSVRLGADVHLLAAVGEIGDETAETAATLCRAAGVDLLILGRHELRPTS